MADCCFLHSGPRRRGAPRCGGWRPPAPSRSPGGRIYRTWLFDGRFPGPEIRVREGERLRVELLNRLPEGTSIHWHGVPVPNGMDGVPGVTQAPVAPGQRFVYDFAAQPAGSYLYHSHSGLQLDRALAGPLIVEEASPHVAYDREHTLLFDDFLPGAPRAAGGGMGMGMGAPRYAGLLVNGGLPQAAPVFPVQRSREVGRTLPDQGIMVESLPEERGHADRDAEQQGTDHASQSGA